MTGFDLIVLGLCGLGLFWSYYRYRGRPGVDYCYYCGRDQRGACWVRYCQWRDGPIMGMC